MKCYCCDRQLSPEEIKYNPKYGHGLFDPCGICLEEIESCFEPLTEEEIDYLFLTETDTILLDIE